MLTPWSGVRPGQIAKDLHDRLEARNPELLKTARMALSGSRVVVCAGFDALVGDIVPLTGGGRVYFSSRYRDGSKPRTRNSLGLTTKGKQKSKPRQFDETFNRILKRIDDKLPLDSGDINVEFTRYCALVGFIDQLRKADPSAKAKLAALAYKMGAPALDEDELLAPELGQTEGSTEAGAVQMECGRSKLLKEIYESAKALLKPPEKWETYNGIFLISLNRNAAQSSFESRATIKGDAVLSLFDVKTTGIVFAVIDGGIDATHPGFLNAADEDIAKLGTPKQRRSA